MNKLITLIRESNTARFFIPAGLILLVFGVISFVVNSNNQNYIEVESTVTKVDLYEEAHTDIDGNFVDASYTVTLNYTVNEREYNATLDNVSKYNIGDKMTIYYNPTDPSQITQTKSLVLPIVFIVLGIASLTAGIISAVNAFKKMKKMKDQERSW